MQHTFRELICTDHWSLVPLIYKQYPTYIQAIPAWWYIDVVFKNYCEIHKRTVYCYNNYGCRPMGWIIKLDYNWVLSNYKIGSEINQTKLLKRTGTKNGEGWKAKIQPIAHRYRNQIQNLCSKLKTRNSIAFSSWRTNPKSET